MTRKQQLARTLTHNESIAASETDEYLANVMTEHLIGHYVREQRVRHNGTLALQYDSALSYWASTSPFQL